MSKNYCYWYNVCPVKYFYYAGRIEEHWVRDYCHISNPDCVRKQMEERGEYHPDNMMPDGTIREDLH